MPVASDFLVKKEMEDDSAAISSDDRRSSEVWQLDPGAVSASPDIKCKIEPQDLCFGNSSRDDEGTLILNDFG